MIERITGIPEFLAIAGFRVDSSIHEVVGRRRLDTRQVVPYFLHEGALYVGVLQRSRASRILRGTPAVGREPIGFDFSGVDETADIRDYGRAIFSARSGIAIDTDALALPLPSLARSIGWTTELALPLLLAVRPPPSRAIDVEWDGGHHRIVFERVEDLALEGAHAEELAIARSVLSPRPRRRFTGDDRAWLDRFEERVRDHAWIASSLRAPIDLAPERLPGLRGDELRFLRLDRVRENGRWWEVVTPRHGASVAVLPYVVRDGEPYFLLWIETRVSALERRARQPIFDLPIHPRHLNATARYVEPAELQRDARALAESILQGTMQRALRVLSAEALGTAEPAPSFGNEVRTRIACAIDPSSIEELPPDVAIVSASELTRAVRAGLVRDPVVVASLLDLGFDPFEDARRGEPRKRRAFLDRMTEGSVVQRRLRTYSSIEREQLESKTYARVMLLLQHEYGVRIAYPESEGDRSFFKAAFRVFMAAPRGDEDRALQGLHWSHDAFHFALGNFTLPATAKFEDWYLSDEKLPPAPPAEGPLFDAYARALKAAEDEATFFSFWQLYEDQPSLTRYVGKLTYFEALRELSVHERAEARAIFDDITTRAEIPERVLSHPSYTREEIRALFEYMRGFRDYHLGDIRAAWAHASRDMYRGFFLRFGIYESDADRYVASVRSFMDRLENEPPGLNPLRALAADVRVAIALRVFDVTKSLRLQRQVLSASERRLSLHLAHVHLEAIEHASDRLADLRAELHNAELSSENERRFAALEALAADVESIRAHIWDDAATVLPANVVAAERTRELPR